MKQVYIDVNQEIKNILPSRLIKDIRDNEEICNVCHGLGIVKKITHLELKKIKIHQRLIGMTMNILYGVQIVILV